MASTDSQTITLPNGRTLGYAEYGDPKGTPILYFHGFPESRIGAYPLHEMALRRNIRLLSIDRPSFGLSTPDPKRRIVDWPKDVEAFASQLSLSHYAVMGVSGGGPYALACAALLPNKTLTAVGVVAGAPLWDRGILTRGVPWYARLNYLLGNYFPLGLKVVTSALVGASHWALTTKYAEKKIDAWLESTAKAEAAKKEEEEEGKTNKGEEAENSPSEATPLLATTETEAAGEVPSSSPSSPDKPPAPPAERRQRLMRLLFEGFAQGTSGLVQETQLLSRDFGFRFEDITYEKVQLWHGTRDANAPVRNIRDIAARIPYRTLIEFDDTHFSLGKRFEAIFEDFVGEIRRKEGRVGGG
ncbi:hypothetical protein MMC25_002301 [Agyrium rufum]|nr:hypothetical protein [Agyrium rufum]